MRGPVDVTVQFTKLTASLNCNAFGGDGIELEFMWTFQSSAGLNESSETLVIDPVDNSTTSTIKTNVLSISDRGSQFMCQVRYAAPDPNSASYGPPETATLSIGK